MKCSTFPEVHSSLKVMSPKSHLSLPVAVHTAPGVQHHWETQDAESLVLKCGLQKNNNNNNNKMWTALELEPDPSSQHVCKQRL